MYSSPQETRTGEELTARLERPTVIVETPRVISNFNNNDNQVSQLVTLLHDVQKEYPVLEPGKDLILIYRDASGLEKIAERIQEGLRQLNPDLPVEMHARLKRGFEIEKILRRYAERRRLHKEHDKRILDADDFYGIEQVAANEEGAYLVGQMVKSLPFLELYDEEEHRKIGSKHYHMAFGRDGVMEGMAVAIQVTDRKNHELNIHDEGARGHSNYKEIMMQKPHRMPERAQIVIIDPKPEYRIICPGIETERAWVMRAQDRLTGVPYHLINPKEKPN